MGGLALQYPIRAVAKLTGLPVDTLRAWERRYQAVTPVHTARGRSYSEADVRRLILLRSVVEGGHAIGQVAALQDAELETLARSKAPALVAKPSSSGGRAAAPPELQRVLDAVGSYDYLAANQELGRLALLLDRSALVYQVVLPLMRLAGDRWERGEFQIAQEHLLSASVRNLLGGMVRQQGLGIGAPRVLLTTPAGELHEFGILAAALLAVAHEFQVFYLGPNLPAPEILQAAAQSSPRAIVIGIMEVNATPAAIMEMRQLWRDLPEHTELWLGGSGAERAAHGLEGSGAFLLNDLTDFERQLQRLKS